jgi:hypothetical protein
MLRPGEVERIAHSMQALTEDMLATVSRFEPGFGLTSEDFGNLNGDKDVHGMHQEFSSTALQLQKDYAMTIIAKVELLQQYAQIAGERDLAAKAKLDDIGEKARLDPLASGQPWRNGGG